jgi:hypothetical protein
MHTLVTFSTFIMKKAGSAIAKVAILALEDVFLQRGYPHMEGSFPTGDGSSITIA